jgi:transcriptional regulator with XRE-family HTH domain
MKRENLTQRRLAERLDCQEGTISKLLNGQMEMTQSWLAGIATAMNREVTDLYRHPDQPSADELLRRLPQEKREEALRYIDFLAKNTGT